MSDTSMLYIFELMNESAVGPFADHASARAWMARVVPPEDQLGNEADYPGSGYRIGTLAEVNEQLSSPEFETPEHAEGRYAECYEEYYPGFKR